MPTAREYRGRRVGAIGHLGSFSFQSSKNLTCGEGGIILTNDDELAERCRSIHNCGRIAGGPGTNTTSSRQLPAGRVPGRGPQRPARPPRSPDPNPRPQRPAIWPSGWRGCRASIRRHAAADCTRHGYHLFLFRIDAEPLGVSREALLEALAAEGVPVCAGYVLPLYRQPLFLNRAFGPYRGYRPRRPIGLPPNAAARTVRRSAPAKAPGSNNGSCWARREDMDDIAAGIRKSPCHNRDRLAASKPCCRRPDRMIVGTSQIDITPQPGIELSGFAVRPQPSTEVLDPLAVRGVYLEDGQERLLWLHADLVAFEAFFVEEMRQSVERECGDPRSCASCWSATHTHSGPPPYRRTASAPRSAIHGVAQRTSSSGRTRLLDQAGRMPCRDGRRPRSNSGWIDANSPRRTPIRGVGAVGLRRGDGTFKAVLLSYSMHPVCLRGSWLSADWPGETARVLSQALPGQPTVLVSSGACGNINPPASRRAARADAGVGAARGRGRFGEVPRGRAQRCAGGTRDVSRNLRDRPLAAGKLEPFPNPRTCRPLPGRLGGQARVPRGIRLGRRNLAEDDDPARQARREPPFTPAEIFGVAMGGTVFVAVNAEIFSRFTELVRDGGIGRFTPSAARAA